MILFMAKKYNKITQEQVLQLFEDKDVISKFYVCEKLGCSIYSARQELEDLRDQKIIKLSNHGWCEV